MYDPVNVATFSASSTSASNALVAVGLGTADLLLHKVTLNHADGTAAHAVSMFDATTTSGTAKVILAANEVTAAIWYRYTEVNFNPPIRFRYLSTTITGTCTTRIHYTWT